MKRWEVDGQVRFVTFSCQRRLPLFSNPRIAQEFVLAMADARRRHKAELFAWVVMPEHVHLLLRPAAQHPLGPMLRSLKMAVSKEGGPALA
jgi:putative transposase